MGLGIKSLLKQTPLIGPHLVGLRRRIERLSFSNSSDYWEQRYARGGNSGAGSYNRLAEFKADFLNRFVSEHRIGTVLEFGCGDGAQLKLAQYPEYTGVDVSETAVRMCRELFSGDGSKRFLKLEEVRKGTSAELVLSLDVIYHLVEDFIYESYMRSLFESARRFVIIYSSNKDNEWPSQHVRHRRFTKWIEENEPAWRLISITENPYPFDPANLEHTSFADFYVFAAGDDDGRMQG